ncbi:MAG: Na+:solute symporter [Phycisphaerae bacterium]|nr:Na+:solute symporter [Phycisphaerae bacterium]
MTLLIGGLQRPDYIVLVGYFTLMLGIGAYFYRYMRRMKDYFSGGNQIPWWLSGVSFYMSSFSVAAFVFYSALAYNYGWVAVTLYWVTIPATMVSVIFFATRWRRARIDSPVEYLETRYSPAVRQLFAWQGLPVRIIDDALKLVAIGLFIHKGLDVSMSQSILWSGLIMLTYTFMGGLWAVAVTDFIQFVVMAAAVIVLLPLSIAKVGGIGAFLSNAPDGFFSLTHEDYSWIYVCSNILLYVLAFSSINWSLIQRYYCVPTERDAKKVGWLVVVLNVIGPPVLFIPAMAARQFLGEVADSGQVYPLLCVELLPAGMLGLIIAAMFAATMSMLSSDYNVCAGVLTNDVYRRLIRPQAEQKELVVVGRLMTLLIGVVSLGTAFLMANLGGEDLFRTMVKLFSIATAPVAIPMLAGLLSKRVTNTAALTGFLAGILTGLLLLFMCPDEFELFGTCVKQENAILFGTTAATLAYMLLVSRADRLSSAERERVESFVDRLEIPIGRLDEDTEANSQQATISPFRIVGISTVLIGVLMLVILNDVGDGLAFWMDAIIGGTLVGVGGVVTLMSGRSRRLHEEST